MDCITRQTPLSLEFSRQEYHSGDTFPSVRGLQDPGIELEWPAWQADSSPSEPPGKPTDRQAEVLTKAKEPLDESERGE